MQADIISEAGRNLRHGVFVGTDAEGETITLADADYGGFIICRTVLEGATALQGRIRYQLTNSSVPEQRTTLDKLDTARHVADRSFRTVGYDGHPDSARRRVCCGG